VEAEAVAKQLLTMAEQFTTPPPADLVSRRVILPCNEECTALAEERARQARNLALISGLGLEDKDIGGHIQDEGPTYSEFVIEHVSGFGGRWELRRVGLHAAAWLMRIAFDFYMQAKSYPLLLREVEGALIKFVKSSSAREVRGPGVRAWVC
jgi:hypothetical protein